MFEAEKLKWIDFFQSYRELSILWDRQHQDYSNKDLREEAYAEILNKYRLIHEDATIANVKKKINNFRCVFNTERKKVRSNSKYTPTLWYFKHLSFLDPTLENSRQISKSTFSFNRCNNTIYLDTNAPSRKLKRVHVSSTPKIESDQKKKKVLVKSESESEEENSKIAHSAPKSRIQKLLNHQERFIGMAEKILTKKPEDWEVIGKALGQQLFSLQKSQRVIAHKLISDALFYGNMEKLTENSCLHLEVEEEEESKENIDDFMATESVLPSMDDDE